MSRRVFCYHCSRPTDGSDNGGSLRCNVCNSDFVELISAVPTRQSGQPPLPRMRVGSADAGGAQGFISLPITLGGPGVPGLAFGGVAPAGSAQAVDALVDNIMRMTGLGPLLGMGMGGGAMPGVGGLSMGDFLPGGEAEFESLLARLFMAHQAQTKPADEMAVAKLPRHKIGPRGDPEEEGCSSSSQQPSSGPGPLTEGEACTVCQEEWEAGNEAIEMPCGHCFHSHCLLPWLEQNNTCPVCRKELPIDTAKQDRQLRESLSERTGIPASRLPGMGVGGTEAGTQTAGPSRGGARAGAARGAAVAAADPAGLFFPVDDLWRALQSMGAAVPEGVGPGGSHRRGAAESDSEGSVPEDIEYDTDYMSEEEDDDEDYTDGSYDEATNEEGSEDDDGTVHGSVCTGCGRRYSDHTGYEEDTDEDGSDASDASTYMHGGAVSDVAAVADLDGMPPLVADSEDELPPLLTDSENGRPSKRRAGAGGRRVATPSKAGSMPGLDSDSDSAYMSDTESLTDSGSDVSSAEDLGSLPSLMDSEEEESEEEEEDLGSGPPSLMGSDEEEMMEAGDLPGPGTAAPHPQEGVGEGLAVQEAEEEAALEAGSGSGTLRSRKRQRTADSLDGSPSRCPSPSSRAAGMLLEHCLMDMPQLFKGARASDKSAPLAAPAAQEEEGPSSSSESAPLPPPANTARASEDPAAAGPSSYYLTPLSDPLEAAEEKAAADADAAPSPPSGTEEGWRTPNAWASPLGSSAASCSAAVVFKVAPGPFLPLQRPRGKADVLGRPSMMHREVGHGQLPPYASKVAGPQHRGRYGQTGGDEATATVGGSDASMPDASEAEFEGRRPHHKGFLGKVRSLFGFA